MGGDTKLDSIYFGSRKFSFVAEFIGIQIDQISLSKVICIAFLNVFGILACDVSGHLMNKPILFFAQIILLSCGLGHLLAVKFYVNFLLAQLTALFIAYLFRAMLCSSVTSPRIRHWTAMSMGIGLSYFCFGKDVLFAFFLAVMCYVLMFLPASIFHLVTLVLSMAFLSAVHIHRQFYQDGVFVIDITGPLMIAVQKATTLAFSFHDGVCRKEKDLTELQAKLAIRKKPSALEYFGYLLNFHSMLAGPFFLFTDYKDFIEGNHISRKSIDSATIDKVVNNNKCNGEHLTNTDKRNDPSPTIPALKKMMVALMCALVCAFILPLFPITFLTEPAFFAASFIYKNYYIVMSTSLTRFLYYTAWILGDAICNMSGIGFNGYSENGNAKWDLISNVNIIGVEFATSFRDLLSNWNIGTMKWLRYVVYERTRFQKTLATYLLSSLWHGFYPGYYFTFLGAAFFTTVSRVGRRSLRWRVLQYGKVAKIIYDVITFIFAHLALAYIAFPFVLLKFKCSFDVYV